jgi:(E)-benzylidenesuccinyl-CoA hydratase
VTATEHGAEPLLASAVDGVGWIRLNRPEKRNAVTMEMRASLAHALAEFDADETIRAVVLTGEGRAFCAGVDLTEKTHDHPLLARSLAAPLESFGKPLLAAINGPAVGGGLELALASDLRIAASTATFGLPEVRLGSLPGSGGVHRLLRAISSATAARMIFTGEQIDAVEAHRVGLVSDVVEPGELETLAETLARTIAANAPLSLRAAKLVLRETQDRGGALELERALWGLLAFSDDRREGRDAFREQRRPRYTGK